VVIAAGARPHVGRTHEKRDIEPGDDCFYEAPIVCGFPTGAEHVVEVGGGQVDIELGAKPGEDNEKSGGVGAAGDPDESVLAGS